MIRTAAGAVLLLAPALTQAHSPFPGLKGLYTGFLHPLTQPAQVMLLVGLGVCLGVRAGARKGVAAAVLAVLAAVGLAGGALWGRVPDLAPLLALLVVALGAAALLPWPLPVGSYVALAGASGLLLGLACVPDPGRWREVVITSAGSWLGIGYFSVLAIGGTVALLDRWPGAVTRIGLQVAAAWLVAMASMYVAFAWIVAPAGPS